MEILKAWESFYVIVGSAAGALVGLQFITLTLFATRPVANIADANKAFSSPTIVHFSAVLLLSAWICAPWDNLAAAATGWGLLGVCGLVYNAVVGIRMKRQKVYEPVPGDWFTYLVLPVVGHLTLIAS